MKCRPGDLAVIISHRFSANIGAFVRIRDIILDDQLDALWTFDQASKPLILGGSEQFSFLTARKTTADNLAVLRDIDLHPIRDTSARNPRTRRLDVLS